MNNRRIYTGPIRWILLLLLSASIGATAQAQTYTVADVPNVVLTDSLRLTSDPMGILPKNELIQLDESLVSLRRTYGIETAIVLLPSIGQRDIESFGTELFRAWGIGKKENNSGLLILLVLDQRRLRFEVGYGLEAILTDSKSSRIQRRVMIPEIKRGNYGMGLIAGVRELDRLFAQEWTTEGTARQEREGIDLSAILMFYGLFLIVILLSLGGDLTRKLKSIRTPRDARRELSKLNTSFNSTILLFLILCFPVSLIIFLWKLYTKPKVVRLSTQCEHCQNHTMRLLPPQEGLRHLAPGQQREAELGSNQYNVYVCASCHTPDVIGVPVADSPLTRCPSCGYKTLLKYPPQRITHQQRVPLLRLERRCQYCDYNDYEDRRMPKSSDHSSELLTGMILSGLLGSTRSSGRGFGGGFGGGSFGGGSSGGGGATSGW